MLKQLHNGESFLPLILLHLFTRSLSNSNCPKAKHSILLLGQRLFYSLVWSKQHKNRKGSNLEASSDEIKCCSKIEAVVVIWALRRFSTGAMTRHDIFNLIANSLQHPQFLSLSNVESRSLFLPFPFLKNPSTISFFLGLAIAQPIHCCTTALRFATHQSTHMLPIFLDSSKNNCKSSHCSSYSFSSNRIQCSIFVFGRANWSQQASRSGWRAPSTSSTRSPFVNFLLMPQIPISHTTSTPILTSTSKQYSTMYISSNDSLLVLNNLHSTVSAALTAEEVSQSINMNWDMIAREDRLYKGKELYRWDDSPGLGLFLPSPFLFLVRCIVKYWRRRLVIDHHCGVCGKPLHSKYPKDGWPVERREARLTWENRC